MFIAIPMRNPRFLFSHSLRLPMKKNFLPRRNVYVLFSLTTLDDRGISGFPPISATINFPQTHKLGEPRMDVARLKSHFTRHGK